MTISSSRVVLSGEIQFQILTALEVKEMKELLVISQNVYRHSERDYGEAV